MLHRFKRSEKSGSFELKKSIRIKTVCLLQECPLPAVPGFCRDFSDIVLEPNDVIRGLGEIHQPDTAREYFLYLLYNPLFGQCWERSIMKTSWQHVRGDHAHPLHSSFSP